MFNLDQIQSHLKSPAVTTEQLINYVKNPNGQVPSVLALAELKRREELKTSAMPPQGAQPTVAQKVVASAAPQQASQGISDLPLPETMYNEKNYAAGGIVAFAEGGNTGMNLEELPTLNLNTGVSSLGRSSGMQDYTIAPNNIFAQLFGPSGDLDKMVLAARTDPNAKNLLTYMGMKPVEKPKTYQMAQGGVVAFDDGGDVDLKTRSRFTPLTNEEKQIIAAQYNIGADVGNQRGSVGAEFAGMVNDRGTSVPRGELYGRYMTDQGNQYSARYAPDARALGIDRQSGRTSVGADVAPGPDNTMGLRSIRGSYITDNGTRYGAGYNVDSRQALLERINQEGNSLGLTASPDSVGIRGAYNFAQGGAIGYAPGGVVYGIDEDTYNSLSPQDQAIVQADYAKKDAIRPRSFTKDLSSVIQTMTNLPSAIASKFAGAGLKAGQNLAESYGYVPTPENKAYVQNFNYPSYIPRATEVAPTKEEETAAKTEDVKDTSVKAGIKEPSFVPSKVEPVKGLSDYASELENYMGPDKSREARDARMAKMEARAKDMEDRNAGMSMLTAGLDILGGTSPYAAVNLARGKSGIEQYQKTQDKLAELEEKRYQLITDAEKADRQEKLTYAKYGADTKQHKEALAHAEKMQNNLLKNEWEMTKYKTDAEIYKTGIAAAAKGVPTIEERLKVREKIPDLMVAEEKKILDKIGGDSNNPKSPNYPLYNKLMNEARARLESEMIAPLGKPVINSSAWGNLKVSK